MKFAVPACWGGDHCQTCTYRCKEGSSPQGCMFEYEATQQPSTPPRLPFQAEALLKAQQIRQCQVSSEQHLTHHTA
jgi:hypothetical protein